MISCPSKRRTLAALPWLAAGALPAWAGAAASPQTAIQTGAYPRRPIHWVVPYATGGTTDQIARRMAARMARNLGQEVVVDNRPGAASILGATFIARSAGDGYTVGTVDSGTLAFNPALYSTLSYDAQKDFSLIGGLGRMPLVLVVNPALPARDLQQFVALARRSPEGVVSASSGPGSPLHVTLELFGARTRGRLRHVAYKGSAPALRDVVAGEADAMFIDLPPSLAAIRSGQVRVLAVATARRLPILPEVPTMTEAGLPGFEAYAWQGLAGPSTLSEALVRRLSRDLSAALRTADNRSELEALGIQPMPMEAAEFTDFVRREQKLWAGVIRDAHIRLD
ncbi:tripartite tricarboxylate transporter substrate binding protein [Xylophilus sp. Kf1]|nr:tripartite tricarboxylate transporter substrate binding protein [Xylophilus sp. Kf1]